jgi:hypothetical protein
VSTGQKIFTQEELEAAYEQMRRERQAEYHLACQAAEWVSKKCELPVYVQKSGNYWERTSPSSVTYPSPRPITYALAIQHCIYDRFNDWLSEQLSGGESFEIDLSDEKGFLEGTRYTCVLSFYDAHAGGW